MNIIHYERYIEITSLVILHSGGSHKKEIQLMKRIEWALQKICVLVLAVVFLVAGVIACGKSNSTTTSSANATSPTAYQLTHSTADAEHILSWDSVVSRCPEIGGYDKLGDFVHRGESKQLSTGETFAIEMDSPVAWASVRFVKTEWTGETFRSFGVWIMYCETEEGLDEYLQMMGMTQGTPFQEDEDFAISVVETETPMQSIQLFITGKHFVFMLMEYATPDESLFFSKDALTEMLLIARGNITSMEITPLPSNIPGRSSQ